MASRFFLAILAAATVVAGCVVSPQPTPPDEVLIGDRIGLGLDVEAFVSEVAFQASPGAVDPPEGVVVVTNLDTADAPSIASVQPDGSFAIAVPGHPGQSFRFQAKNGNVRSQPLDVLVGASGVDLSALTGEPPCLVLDPARWVALEGAGASRAITVRNQCTGAVAIGSPHLRRSLAGFTFAPAGSLDLAADEVATITVQAGIGAEVEDVLFLDVTAPGPARRAVTLTIPDP